MIYCLNFEANITLCGIKKEVPEKIFIIRSRIKQCQWNSWNL